METNYDTYTLAQLREELLSRGLVPKKWMLTYIKKSEALYLVQNISDVEQFPESFVKVIKARSSVHKKKVYRSRKRREAVFGADLTREERLRKVYNTATSLDFVGTREYPDGFKSYIGSTRGKLAYVFRGISGEEYLFTKSEVEKLTQMGLESPKMEKPKTKSIQSSNTKTLKDLFGN